MELNWNLSQLTMSNFHKFLQSLSQEKKNEIFSNPNNVLELDDSILIMAFQLQSPEVRPLLLENSEIVERILTQNNKNRKRHIFVYLTPEEQNLILKQTKVLTKIDENILSVILQNTTEQQKKYLIENLRNQFTTQNETITNPKLKIIQQILKNHITTEEVQKIWNFPSPLINQFLTLCKQQKRQPLLLLQIDTLNEFIIYLKTNCIIKEGQIKDYQIPIDIIEKINTKQLAELLKLYKEHLKNQNLDLPNEKALIAVIDVYLIFGYDNARKVLLDFFTFPTESSKIKQAELEFNETRKEYRLTHQEEFYNHKMVIRLYKEFVTITNGMIDAENSLFFYSILQTTEKEEYKKFYKELLEKIHLPSEERKEGLEALLKEKIRQREARLKAKYIENTKDKNILQVENKTLYNIFKGLDYSKCTLDDKGCPIINKKITNFFLGNEKRKNDCLLRMVLSKNIFDLKEHVISIINNFSIIEEEVQKSNGSLSLNSLNDIIKVYQITSYSLDYDEQDLSLSCIAKAQKALNFIEHPEVDLVEAILKYHKLRKWKTNLTIPFIKGKTKDNIQYSILRNDSEEILMAGIDHYCCLKPGAKGEDFYHYCLTNPNGGIILLKDEQEKSYIVPFIVNGNTIYGNGIEPDFDKKEENLTKKLLRAIQECYQSIMQNTDIEPIEVGVLTNLHIEKENALDDYPVIIMENHPAEIEFYCDLTKKEKKNHVITQKNSTSKIEHYHRTSRYEQPRDGIFYYSKLQQDEKLSDLKELERKINLVYYTYLKLEELLNPQTFSPIRIEECDFAIGNNDWFILKRKDKILKCVLPYYKDIDIEIEVATQNIEEEEEIKRL